VDDGSMFMTMTKRNLDDLPIQIVEDDMVLESMSSDDENHDIQPNPSNNARSK
jgi:hypothetical protein